MNESLEQDIQLNKEKIKAIDNAIKLVEEKNGLSMLLPDKYDLGRQKMKLEATNEVLRYYQDKLRERKRLETGRRLHAELWYDNERANLTLEIYLDDKTVSELYERVYSSYSDNYTFFKDHFYALAKPILGFDLEWSIDFFRRFCFASGFSDGKTLHFSKKDFDSDVVMAKKHIDKVFKLFEDKKLMDRVEDALDAYLKAVFESNPEEKE